MKKLNLCLGLLLSLSVASYAQQPAEDGKLKYTNLSEQEMYLMRFQSICHHIEADADWDQYLEEYEEKHLAPTYLAGKPGSLDQGKMQADERDLLMANYTPGQVQLAPLAPHFQLQYLYKFYPAEFMKLAPGGGSRQAIANEFDIRKNVPEGKRRMVADAAKLPFGEERYFRGMPMKRSEYDFDNQCFYVTPDFSNVVGFLGMYAGSEAVKIPLTFIEEYKEFLLNLKIPLAEDKAEELFNNLDLSNSYRIWPKVVFTLVDEPSKEPVYVNYNAYNWWTLFPLKFKVKHIDIELINGFYTQNAKLLYRIEDIPEPKWEGWAISSGRLQAEGVKGPYSVSLSSIKSNASSSGGQSTPPSRTGSAGSNGLDGESATSKRNFPFMRFYKNRVKEPYVHYAGIAENTSESLKPFEQIQLELCYAYYFEPNMHLLRLLRPSMVYGGIYLGVKGEKQHLWQSLNQVEYLDDGRGWRFKIGNQPYGKYLRAAGYKNAYFEVSINDDHSMNMVLYDKSGKVHVKSKLRPLNKNEKPPFTNN